MTRKIKKINRHYLNMLKSLRISLAKLKKKRKPEMSSSKHLMQKSLILYVQTEIREEIKEIIKKENQKLNNS